MPKKVALLIGVSHYGEGLLPLSTAPNDVAALKRVLENPEMAGFDQVETLIDPELVDMQRAIKALFSQCMRDDMLLLYFSGHGITDESNHLYFATCLTSKDDFEATAVPASFIHQQSMHCYARRQVIILDCCYSGAFKEGWQAKSAGLDLQQELGAEGRVVLTSSTATQLSFQKENTELSLYTQYLVEGIETGAADQDSNGKIFAHELHDYAKAKVQEVKPKQKPGIILDKEGFNILISQAPVNDPELDFRKLTEKYAIEGEITVVGRYILQVKRQELGITEEKSDEIINEVLTPYRKRIENIEFYKKSFADAIEHNYPLSEQLLNELKDLENVLGLEDKDIENIQHQILTEKKIDYKNQRAVQQEELQKYENKLEQEGQSCQEIELTKKLERTEEKQLKRQQKENILEEYLSTQVGTLSSEKARRSLLLRSTTLSLFLILLGFSFVNNYYFIFVESLALLVGSICVVLARPYGLTLWRRLVMWLGVGLTWFAWYGFVSEGQMLGYMNILQSFGDFFTLLDVPGLSGIIILTIYFVSIYIGRW